LHCACPHSSPACYRRYARRKRAVVCLGASHGQRHALLRAAHTTLTTEVEVGSLRIPCEPLHTAQCTRTHTRAHPHSRSRRAGGAAATVIGGYRRLEAHTAGLELAAHNVECAIACEARAVAAAAGHAHAHTRTCTHTHRRAHTHTRARARTETNSRSAVLACAPAFGNSTCEHAEYP
jgi:hypothetical protein